MIDTKGSFSELTEEECDKTDFARTGCVNTMPAEGSNFYGVPDETEKRTANER